MGKQTNAGGQKPLDLRLDHLHRAAVYLSDLELSSQHKQGLQNDPEPAEKRIGVQAASIYKADVKDRSAGNQLSRHLLLQMKDVAMKAQRRLTPNVKHSMCHRCGVFLGDSASAEAHVHNPSSGGRKSWAAIQITKCLNCGLQRRAPVFASRQPRKVNRTTQEINS